MLHKCRVIGLLKWLCNFLCLEVSHLLLVSRGLSIMRVYRLHIYTFCLAVCSLAPTLAKFGFFFMLLFELNTYTSLLWLAQ